MKQVNVQGTANVVDAALESGVRRLVHISSTSATGRLGKGETVDEATPWKPGKHHSYYGVTKHLAEIEVWRGVAEGLPAVILNPATIIGHGDWTSGTPKVFRMVDRGWKLYLPTVNGFVGASDVCRAVTAALSSPHEKGERFLLVTESLSQKDFLASVARSIEKPAPNLAFPLVIGIPFGWISETLANWLGKEPLITRSFMAQARRKVFYDASKATRELGISYTPMEEVIRETGNVFLKENRGTSN